MKTNNDFDFLKIQKQYDNTDLHAEFYRIAKILFEQFVIIVNGTVKFSLVEIEFYFLSLWHQDYFTYGYPEQKEFVEWFSHAAGIDLTFGDASEGIYAGILIRSVRENKEKGMFINGSINVRNALSNTNSNVSTKELRNSVGLFQNENVPTKDVFISPRIGLTEKSFKEHYNRIEKDLIFNGQAVLNPDVFINRDYRFIYDVCPKNKFKNKIMVAENSFKKCGYSREHIKKLYEWDVLKKSL